LVGAAVLVGYTAAGVARVATPFSLPTVLRMEGSRDGTEVGEQVPLGAANLSLYLDASEELARIDVLDASGAVVASLTAADFEPADAGPQRRTLQVGGAPSPRDVLQSEFPQIDFLEAGADPGFNLRLRAARSCRWSRSGGGRGPQSKRP
jgi:hypothetical protein